MVSIQLFIRVFALFFVGYGVAFVAFPAQLLHWVTDANISTASGLIDVRATYGGMSLAVGIALWLMSNKLDTYRQGLQSILMLMVMMAIGRIYGMFIDGDANTIMFIYLGLEVGASVMCLLLLKVADSEGK